MVLHPNWVVWCELYALSQLPGSALAKFWAAQLSLFLSSSSVVIIKWEECFKIGVSVKNGSCSESTSAASMQAKFPVGKSKLFLGLVGVNCFPIWLLWCPVKAGLGMQHLPPFPQDTWGWSISELSPSLC